MATNIWFETIDATDIIHDSFSKNGLYREYDVELKCFRKRYGSLFFCKVKYSESDESLFKFVFKLNNLERIRLLLTICQGIVESLITSPIQ